MPGLMQEIVWKCVVFTIKKTFIQHHKNMRMTLGHVFCGVIYTGKCLLLEIEFAYTAIWLNILTISDNLEIYKKSEPYT